MEAIKRSRPTRNNSLSSGRPSQVESREYNVILPTGEIHHVLAVTSALAIRSVTSNPKGVCVTEGDVTRSLGPCCRCGVVIWHGDRHTVRRQSGKTPTKKLVCEDCG